jgi:HK97 family phage major capsid protein
LPYRCHLNDFEIAAMSKAKHKQIPQQLRAALAKDNGRAVRELQFERATVNAEARTVELCFATETPYERWWGIEVLDCGEGSVRTQRLRAGCNLIMDHDARDVVAVVESFSFGADKKLRAVVRFGKSARAQEVFADVADGIRTNVSVGYLIHKAILVSETEGVGTYRITDWEPYELTLTSVPADINAGVGRSLEDETRAGDEPDADDVDAEEEAAETPGEEAEEEQEEERSAALAAQPQATATTRGANMPDPVIETPVQRNHATEISTLCASMKLPEALALKSIQAGHTVEQFQLEAIRELAKRPVPSADIGLTDKEVKSFNILRAINALATPNDRRAIEAAAFEFDCSRAVAEKFGRAAQGFYLPSDVQARRDLTAGTNNAGGYTVATELRGFIDLLRNAMVIDKAGAVFLSGLVGNIAIPKMTAAGTAYWVAENGAPTESQQTLGQVTMSPKTIGAFTDISRQLLLQSSIDVQNMVTRDLATIVGLGIQQAAINGSGSSNQPSGILTQVTPGTVGGTNGAAPSWANIVGLETNVSVANAAVGTLGYLTNAKVRGKLKVTEQFATTNGKPVWAEGTTPLNGYGAYVTNAVPANLTKGTASGVCSAIIFGNFADLIVGMWGATDILVDPYTGGAAGTVRVRVLQSCDIALRHVESFDSMVDALTT